jgi:hypothetical protein
MQKNSTFAIIGRFIILVAFIASSIVLAHFAWAGRILGLNSESDFCEQADIYPDGHEVDSMCHIHHSSSFFTYTGDFWSIVWSQILGLVAAFVVFGIIWLLYWIIKNRIIFKRPGSYHPCKNEHCPCVSHKGDDVLIDGEMERPDCTDPQCPCDEHKNEVFKNGKWTY